MRRNLEKAGVSEKRFSLSGEKFAKDRIEAVKSIVKELKQRHPEILSLCLYGSMVKGSARPESDIDGYLFIDANSVAEKLNLQEDDILDGVGIENEYLKEDSGQGINNYNQEIRGRLKERSDLSQEQVMHVRAIAISERIIDRQLAALIEQIQKVRDFDERFKQWEASEPHISNNMTWEEIEQKYDEYFRQRPEHPDLPDPTNNLCSMFHLETGGGIRKYRQYLIDKLAALGEIGEKVWEEIIKKTEELEQNFQTETNKNYPRTLEKAKQIYAS